MVLQQRGGGIETFTYFLNKCGIPQKYTKIFLDLYIKSKNEKLVFIDGGAHAGHFSDIALYMKSLVYAFEPNYYLGYFLKDKYENNKNFIFFQQALSDKNQKLMFYNANDSLISDGASIVKTDSKELNQEEAYEVECIDLCAFIKELLNKHSKISVLKLDIEGAEFEILDKLLDEKLFKNIDYIFAETHERFFDNPKQKINALKEKVEKAGAKNIFLDWA